MTTFKFSISEWRGISLELIFRLVWVSTILAIGAWLWPEGILETPIARIDLGTALWAASSVVLVGIGLVALYFVVVEPYALAYSHLKQESRTDRFGQL